MAARTDLRYPNTGTGLSGTVHLTNPDGTPDTDYAPLTGLEVRIQSGGTILENLPIASNGTFSDPDFTPSATESVFAEVVGYGVDGSESPRRSSHRQ